MRCAESEPARFPYVIAWEFHVKAGLESRFEETYGPDGAWARLFARGEGYLGTQLHRDVRQKGRYVTLDCWASQAAYESFRERWNAAYQALDVECESLTERETALGSFLSVGKR